MLVLDIETYRTRCAGAIDRITEEVLARRPAQNTPKETKLEWDCDWARAARLEEALSKTAVDVLLAEPLCVCWRLDDWEDKYGVEAMCDGEWNTDLHEPAWTAEECFELERVMLCDLARQWGLQTGPETIWVGHNVQGFDLAVLMNRWRRHGIVPPPDFPRYVNGRWRGRIFDTMLMAPCKNGLGLVSCDDVCEAYGVQPEWYEWRGEPMDGSRVAEAYEAGAYGAILDYCHADVATEQRLYQQMTGNDSWGTYDRRSELAEQIKELKGSELSEGARAIAIVKLLEGAGLVPR